MISKAPRLQTSMLCLETCGDLSLHLLSVADMAEETEGVDIETGDHFLSSSLDGDILNSLRRKYCNIF